MCLGHQDFDWRQEDKYYRHTVIKHGDGTCEKRFWKLFEDPSVSHVWKALYQHIEDLFPPKVGYWCKKYRIPSALLPPFFPEIKSVRPRERASSSLPLPETDSAAKVIPVPTTTPTTIISPSSPSTTTTHIPTVHCGFLLGRPRSRMAQRKSSQRWLLLDPFPFYRKKVPLGRSPKQLWAKVSWAEYMLKQMSPEDGWIPF